MPYKTISDLPESLQGHLPKHAQEIYMKAFNSAYHIYADPEKRRDDQSLDATAARIAWAAVKKEYEKNETGHWVKKSAIA